MTITGSMKPVYTTWSPNAAVTQVLLDHEIYLWSTWNWPSMRKRFAFEHSKRVYCV